MKLKGFGKQLHNIFFHTHTVAGIVISFALYIIFFAGAFALFMDEAYQWENPAARYETPEKVDIDRALSGAQSLFPDWDYSEDFSISLPTQHNPELKVFAFVTNPDSTSTRVSALVNTETYETISFEDQKTHMMETLYHLHYFGQIPYGLYIAGFVSLFFFFATITGLLTHWKDIFAKFYALRTKAGLKNLWKDAHTTLGLIGLPFQIIYGVTGALLGLSILLLAPSVVLLFNDSQDEVRGMLDPFFAIKSNADAEKTDDVISAQAAYDLVHSEYSGYETGFLRFRNYGTREAAVSVQLDDKQTVTGVGTMVVDMHKGEIVHREVPSEKGYSGVYDIMIRLHYALYGGIWLKIVYFLLALLTCFMIISGVLLWQSARDNVKYTDKQRLFHHRVTKVYLSVCFSLYPAIAIIFIANMVVPFDMGNRILVVDSIFFISWLLLCLSTWFKDTYREITRYFLLIGTALVFIVPIANGVVTGDWLWVSLSKGMWSVAGVDLFWIICGVTGLIGLRAMNRRNSQDAAFIIKEVSKKVQPTYTTESV